MKIAVVLYSDELSSANSLLSQASTIADNASCQLWVLGGLGASPYADSLCFPKITEILFSKPEYLLDPICCAEAVKEYYLSNSVDIILFSTDIRGNELAARLSALIGCEAFLSAKTLFSENAEFYIKKPVYSNNLLATFRIQALPFVVSMPASEQTLTHEFHCKRELIQYKSGASSPSYLTDIENEAFENGGELKSAKLVFAAGRGVGKAENFKKLEALAKNMGAVLGGTRPTVCDGKISPERMLGMSANVLSPACCIVFGASGAAPFLAGVENSKLLIAVNRDPNALIFNNCDVGIIADCNEFAQALSKQLEQK